jgi:hypothetical protein
MSNALAEWTSEISDDPTRGKTIRFVTDGFVVGREKVPLAPGRQYICIGHAEGWRRLEAGMRPQWIVREPGQERPPEPHVDINEYVTDLSGQKVSPWKYMRWLYLVDNETGVISTFETGSTGGAMSIADLSQQIAGMRQLKRAEAVPVVELKVQTFKTRFGVKKRPDFDIVGWKVTGGEQPLAIAHDPNTGEVLDAEGDPLPF